ncbi:DUF1501 domain-containing protein [Dyadobacter frigoris]|uniref:DUF1501 domain-containing protein n=1 Tax=Dyadobacter frigoris TaxID=2576211 RepID=A0A4U6CUB4_9BACT|nr:DUF1501 domain-containing protein [Dyadobacter frigoris]TKT84874.1 DUF1501 domain-containing protein [Dyadobacter frigoris]GLU57388.1 hypothetical protein Dfri01_68490 [Dyadobacter frigoris]
MKRRDFLKNSTFAAAGTMLIPHFLKAHELSSAGATRGKVLVVIQLSGGNDGLNTVIPYRNDIYYRERPSLSINKSEVLTLNDEIGLNPALEAIRNLYDDGRVRILNNVGYPNPDRSHFRSMDIWHSASNADQYVNSGWLGRYLDSSCASCNVKAHHMLEIDDTLILALKGEMANGLAMLDPGTLYRQTKRESVSKIAKTAHTRDQDPGHIGYLYKTLADTASSADYLYEKANAKSISAEYPKGELGKNLKTVSELISSGIETTVYYVSFSGFDTHAGQRRQQDRLLTQYAEAVRAFINDLKKTGQLDRTMVLTFSEFGRRVKQNGSNGTDHGTANNVFLMGGPPRNSVIYNEAPALTDLNGGDLKHSIDFRDIYASLLRDWLGADDKAILGQSFAGLKDLC